MKTVLPDTLKVVLDYNYAKKAQKPNVDTGLFTLIYKGEVSLIISPKCLAVTFSS